MPFFYMILGSIRASFRLSTFIFMFLPKLIWKGLPHSCPFGHFGISGKMIPKGS